MALFRRERTIGIDGDQLRTATLGFLRDGPEMHARRNRIAAPDENQLAVDKVFDVHADTSAVRVAQPRGAGARTDRAIEVGRAELVEEPCRHRFALDESHRASIAVGENCFGLACRNRPQSRGDLVKRLIPTDWHELPAPLRSDALERMQQAIRMIGSFSVSRDFRTQDTLGRRMVRIALDLDSDAIFHCNVHGARIGTVMRACGPNDAGVGRHETTPLFTKLPRPPTARR